MLKRPLDTHPDAVLLALERELEGALILADTLTRAWDEATTDQGRRQIERQADVTLERIARLQREIAATPPAPSPAPRCSSGFGPGSTVRTR